LDIDRQDLKKMSELADSMRGKTEDEAIEDIVEMIRSGQGGMTPERFKQLAKTIEPMLTKSQKSKLDKIIQEL